MSCSKFWRAANSAAPNSRGRRAAALLASIGVVIACVATPLSIRAQSSHEKLEDLSTSEQKRLLALVKKGKTAYEKGDYERSLEAFQEAYRGLEHPDFAYRVALAHQKLGHHDRAIEYFERVIELDPDASDRSKIEERIARLRDKLRGRIVVTTEPEGAVVRLAGEEGVLGRTRIEHELAPGAYTLVVEKEAYENVERTIEIESGADRSFHFSLQPRPTRSSDAERGSGPYWVMGAGGLAVVGSAVSWVIFQNHRQYVEGIDRSQSRPSEYDKRVDRAVFWNRAAIVSGAVGLATVAAGGTWALLRGGGSESASRGRSERSRLRLAPAVSTRGARIQLRLDF